MNYNFISIPIIFISIIYLLFFSNYLSAQLMTETCFNPNTVAGDVAAIYCPEKPGQTFQVQTSNDLQNLIVDLSKETVGWNGTSDYALVVTYEGADNGETVDCIQGVSYDGIFDFFSTLPNGEEFPEGTYKYWGFGYNKNEISPIGENIFVKVLYPCLNGVTEIHEVLDCFLADSSIVSDTACITFPEVIELADSLLQVINLDVCLVLEETPFEIIFEKASTAFCPPVGIDEQNALDLLELYPNPSSGIFHLNLQSLDSKPVDLQVCDLQGRVCHRERLPIATGNSLRSLDLLHLPEGNYILRMLSSSGYQEQLIQLTD